MLTYQIAKGSALITSRKTILSNEDHSKMDEMLKEVLEAVASGDLSPKDAASGLAQVIGAVDSGNLSEAQAWFKNKLDHFRQ